MLTAWELAEADQTDFPVASAKSQYGRALEYLGNMEYLSFGIVNITRRRLGQYNETVDRVKSLLTVERQELSSSVESQIQKG